MRPLEAMPAVRGLYWLEIAIKEVRLAAEWAGTLHLVKKNFSLAIIAIDKRLSAI